MIAIAMAEQPKHIDQRQRNHGYKSKSEPLFSSEQNVSIDIPNVISDIEYHFTSNITDDVCAMPIAKILCKNNLDIPRRLMPQLSSAVTAKYYEHVQAQGFKTESVIIPAEQLSSTQNELHAGTLLKNYQDMMKGLFNHCEREIIAASDPVTGKKHIIDGHHAAKSCQLFGGNQRTILIHQPAKHILEDIKKFDGVIFSSASFFHNKKNEKHSAEYLCKSELLKDRSRKKSC